MYKRLVEKQINEVLSDTRIVSLTGPRQSGKTTLAEKVAGKNAEFLSLDNPTLMTAAQFDPLSFIGNYNRVVIDEVQRVPELLLAIKLSVDKDKRPGRFLITGSTDLRILPVVPDSLAGRIESVLLYPLSQAEILSGQGSFLDAIFKSSNLKIRELRTDKKLVDLVTVGGYPEALERPSKSGRNGWYQSYLDRIIFEDIPKLIKIGRKEELPKILKFVAENTGKIINFSEIKSGLGINHATVQKYLRILEGVYLLKPLQPWYSNKIQRLIKTPKFYLLDTGLLATLNKGSVDLFEQDRTLFKPILETFVISELRKLASWSEQQYNFSFFQNKQGNKVDIIVENQNKQIVGIQVCAMDVVNDIDFNDLNHVAKRCGKDFLYGIVLYDGKNVIRFSEQMLAVPISVLWS